MKVRKPPLKLLVCVALSSLGFWLLSSDGARLSSPGPAASRTPSPSAKTNPVHAPQQPRLVRSFGSLPLSFEPNLGQTDSRAKFISRGRGYSLFLAGDEAVLALRSRQSSVVSNQFEGLRNSKLEIENSKFENRNSILPRVLLHRPADYGPETTRLANSPFRIHNSEFLSPEPRSVVRLNLVGANPRAKVVGLDPLPGKSNYFIGNDPKKWRTNVPNYSRVRIEDVYPGIDQVFYGRDGHLEYDFVVRSGADPTAIKLAVAAGLPRQGPDGGVKPPLQIDASGDLVISTDAGDIRFKKPVVYQPAKSAEAAGISKFRIHNSELPDGNYVLLAENRIGFEVSAYDKRLPLIIDPVLTYSTYLGGSGAEPNGDAPGALAVDSAGDIYVAGYAVSTDFPTTSGSFQPAWECAPSAIYGCVHAFITKFDSSGSSLIYSTFLGGTYSEGASGLALDAQGNAFVTGGSSSTDFPLVNATPTNYTGGSCDAFVAELSAGGDQLLYSTCFAGSGGTALVVDSSGNAYVAGVTGAADFPVTPGAFQTTYSGNGDAFILKLRPDGSPLISSTYLGSPDYEGANIMALDSAGSVYVTGATYGTTFPTTPGAFDTTPGAGCNTFVTKLDPDLSSLTYSTYLCADYGSAISVDSSGNAYVAGSVYSNIFPATSGAFDRTFNGQADGYVAKFNPTGSALVYGTYLGGSYGDYASGLAVDAAGQAYVTGGTGSFNFPTLNAFQPSESSGDIFLTVLNSAGSALVYSTFLGGGSSDQGYKLAVDSSGNAIIVGNVNSTDFPLVKPFQSVLPSQYSMFVARISPANAASAALQPPSISFADQDVSTTSGAQIAILKNVGSQPLTISGISATGDFTEIDTCPSTVNPGDGCTVKLKFTPTGPGLLTGSLVVTDNASDSPQSFPLIGKGLGAAAGLSPASITFPSQFVGTSGLPQNVTLVNTGTIPLTISNVQATSDFAAVNGCTSSVAPGVNCTIGVFFDPSAIGDRTGTLTITDNAPDSPQTVQLSGTGSDFSMALQSPTQALTAGQSVSNTLTISPAGGFDVPVVLTCGGAPSQATCTVNPSSVTPNGTTPSTVTVTITTGGNAAAPHRPQPLAPPTQGVRPLPLLICIAGLLTLLVLTAGRRGRPRLARLSLASLLLFIAGWTACGGGVERLARLTTPPGTYTLAISGTATSGPASLSHTVPLTLTVN